MVNEDIEQSESVEASTALRTSDGSWKTRFETLALEVCGREGVVLYDWELNGAGGARTLRVYVDKPGVGIGIEDCSNVSKGLNLLLDVEDLIPGGAYNLEVSSPGLERVLRRQSHFEAVIGKRVLVKTFAPYVDWAEAAAVELAPALARTKSFDGTLLGVDLGVGGKDTDGAFAVRIETESKNQFRIPEKQIAKANLVFEMNSSHSKKKK